LSRKRLLPLTLIAVVLAGCGARCASAAPDDQSATFDFGGLSRTYLVDAPPGRPTGLVVNLHGGTSTGSQEERLTNFDGVADANGFVVVYPDGIDRNWADGRGASEPDRRGVDDVGFLAALAGKLQNEYGIDPGHVFATGMSNGGFMSNRLGCDRADVFAAIAPVSGTLGANVACNPSRPVAVLEVHGTADPIVPFDGGTMRGRGGHQRHRVGSGDGRAMAIRRWMPERTGGGNAAQHRGRSSRAPVRVHVMCGRHGRGLLPG
jgi:polyhydroxybutyrate depolymerase